MNRPLQHEEAQRLAALYELDLLQPQGFPELDRLTRLAADICGAEPSVLTIFDERRSVQLSVSSGQRIDVANDPTLCAMTLAAGETVMIPDARADPATAKTVFVAGPPYARSYVGTPIGADPHMPVGVLCIVHPEPNRFGHAEIARLERVAELVNSFLANRRETVRANRAAAQTDEERRRQLQFDLIFDAVHEGVNVYALDGRIVESNRSARELLDLSREQQLGRNFRDARWQTVTAEGAPMAPEDYPIVRVLRQGEIVRNVVLGVDLPTGERKWLSVNAAPIRNPQTGAIEYGVVTFKDITLQRLAEDTLSAHNTNLAEALAVAEKASRAKSDFISVMSHELRTPMNAILGCAQLLNLSRMDPVQKRTLGVLEDAGRQMLALLNDLFDLASLDADKVRLQREPVSLVRLIEDAAVIWSAEIRAKGLELAVMIDPGLVAPRDVDPARLLQIIGNLMANAIKFTVAGGISIQAWPVKLAGGRERIEIEVLDTGPGVPEEAAARIFSPFEQIDVSSKRRHGGLGVGLHVARRLAIAMGGDVTLESHPGEGSRFIVRFEAPLSVPATPSPKSSAAHEPAIKDVLCIDDNARNLFVLGAMLRAAGHTVTECASGEEGLACLAQRKFDVILLDMVMPGMDGLGVLARLRADDGPNRATRVIACTANVLPEQVATYLAAGTSSVLSKPIDIKAMLEAVAGPA
jgi:PAS domain S-box-containing protein